MRFLARRRRRATHIVTLIGAVMASLLIAGCAKADPSVVAYVGGSTITQRQLDDALDGVSSILQ